MMRGTLKINIRDITFPRFYPSKVSKIIQNTLEERLKREEFDVQNIPSLSEELVRLVRARVKGIIQDYIE